ncbi:YbaB/EbfC family nucleoid-associated protein [Saccharothrix syringae]|uniref:YbaB/EbfC family DNA-binding protein n=1 Tax=Saccharothrix syringae TaxID=103733 RepID=A0A5Q0GY31_SACSY|nr:YbaB/EbfC family nucleoid-associated protein [Saccharothrix syringae]QFZ18585.1 YbaB/EbfC family DNA-binding protein [Saccharothrix syringae]
MSNPYSEQLSRLMAEYRETQRAMVEAQQRLRSLSVTETAPRRVVSVTVGHGGRVEDIKFPTAAYKRMPPTELASALLDAIAAAQRRAVDEAAEVMAPHMPAGVDARALLSGDVEASSFEVPQSGVSDILRDLMSDPGK